MRVISLTPFPLRRWSGKHEPKAVVGLSCSGDVLYETIKAIDDLARGKSLPVTAQQFLSILDQVEGKTHAPNPTPAHP